MTLTIDFIRKSFNKYNNLYFNGELVEPNFNIINTKTILGRFRRRNNVNIWGGFTFTIEISKYYKFTEQQFDNTIIHEMIHQYIAQKGIKDTSSHGRYFKQIADRINRDGWEIYRCNSVRNVGVSDDNNKEYHMFVIKNRDNRYFLFSSAKNSVNEYKQLLSVSKYEFHYFISNDSVKFGHFSACRKSLRGLYITKQEYDDYVKNYDNK